MHDSIQSAAPKRLTLLNRLAAGGMGEVFLARQEGPAGFVKTVAVKRILDSLATKQEFVDMFLDEARLAARLSHPNIVQVFDLGHEGSSYYLTMEFVDGRSLHVLKRAVRARAQALSPTLVAYICQQALRGLHYAHRLRDENDQPLRIIHRDVTPENILLGFNGVVKLVDFGIAKAALNQTVTQARWLKGKIQYIAPELLRGGEASVQSDVYSMGVLLYEVLTGGWPFPGNTPAEIVEAAVNRPPIPARSRNPELPQMLSDIVMRAIAKDAGQRPADAKQLAEELSSFLDASRVRLDDSHIAAYLSSVFGTTALSAPVPSPRPAPPAAAASRSAKVQQPAQVPGQAKRSARRSWFLRRLKSAWNRDRTPKAAVPVFVPSPSAEAQSNWAPLGRLVAVGSNRVLPLPSHNVTIGRAASNDLVVDGERMPGVAARLRLVEEGQWELTAMSRSGAKVNGTDCERAVIGSGDVLQLGGIEFTLQGATPRPPPGPHAVSGSGSGDVPAAIEDIQAPYDDEPANAHAPVLLGMEDHIAPTLHPITPTGPNTPATPEPQEVSAAVVEPEVEQPTLFMLSEAWLEAASGRRRPLREQMVRIPSLKLQSAYGGTYHVASFWMDRRPVTNAQYFQFIEATGDLPPASWRGRRFAPQEAEHPVVGVSLEAARNYARWRGLRLPTALEWEAAARAPSQTAFPWGDEFDASRCHGPLAGATSTAAVGLHPRGRTPLGCEDMVGNVWEWTELDAVTQAPPEPGYAWVYGGSFCHSCSDDGKIPRRSVLGNKDYLYLGFRCATGAP